METRAVPRWLTCTCKKKSKSQQVSLEMHVVKRRTMTYLDVGLMARLGHDTIDKLDARIQNGDIEAIHSSDALAKVGNALERVVVQRPDLDLDTRRGLEDGLFGRLALGGIARRDDEAFQAMCGELLGRIEAQTGVGASDECCLTFKAHRGCQGLGLASELSEQETCKGAHCICTF